MLKLIVNAVILVFCSVTVFGAEKSTLTAIGESLSSSSYSKVECSMEDYTCQKLILDMGRQEALSRLISGENGPLSVILQQSIEIMRRDNANLSSLSNEQILNILASQE